MHTPDHRTCHHEWSESPEPACVKCAVVGNVALKAVWQENKLIRRHLHHQPKEYMAAKIQKLAGDGVRFLELCAELEARVRTCKTWPAVYAECARVGVGDQFLCVPAWLGHPVLLGSCFKAVEDIVYTLDYRVQFMYVAYKLHQLWNLPRLWIPLKITKPTLVRAEETWRSVCEDYGLPCKKTVMADLKTPWA